MLKFWLDRLKSVSKFKKLLKIGSVGTLKDTADKCIQANPDEEPSTKELPVASKKGSKGRETTKGDAQLLRVSNPALKRMSSRVNYLNTVKGKNLERRGTTVRGLLNPNVTLAKPFQFKSNSKPKHEVPKQVNI